MSEKAISNSTIQDILSKIGLKIDIGDIFVDDHGQILKLIGFHAYDSEYRYADDEKYSGIFDKWDRDNKIWFEPTFSRKISFRYIKKDLIKIHVSPEEFIQESLMSLVNPPEIEEEVVDTETTAITNPSSKDRLIYMRDQMKMVQDKTEAMVRVVNSMMYNHKNLVSQMRDKIDELERIIDLAEAFLGIYQEVHVLQSGENAPIDTPLYIRQRVAFMDEEVGDITREGGVVGIDFNRIDDFDEWLIINERYKYLIPEEKSIVAVRPTNHENEYSGNIFRNAEMNRVNHWMYLLIRNGENIYRIWAEMEVGTLLFPPAKEYEEIMTALLEGRSEKYWSEKSAKQADFKWRRFAILIEGMFYHSSILQPHPPDISLFKQESYEKSHIILIRDGEPSFTDGKIRYKEWKDDINSKIKKGSRIIIANNIDVGRSGDFDSWRWGDRYYSYKPENPKAGVYEVIDEKEIKLWYYSEEPTKIFKILYLPTNGWRDYERRMGFWFKAGDDFILNYDMISLEDVDYFIGSRIEREKYRSVLPSLYKLREGLIEESQYENEFVKLIANELDVSEELIQRAIKWWKYKNIYNRPIKKDDKKAWRMIRKRIKRHLENPDETGFDI